MIESRKTSGLKFNCRLPLNVNEDGTGDWTANPRLILTNLTGILSNFVLLYSKKDKARSSLVNGFSQGISKAISDFRSESTTKGSVC